MTNVLHDKESILPTCATVVTMSLVLPDGKLLATNGLDRELQTVFRIDAALLEYMPRPEDCTDDAIADAFEFLCDEWLIDVQADDTGKCILIAYTLSIIERVLLPERPGFFVKSGRRGTGKTTALRMCVLAATGKEPPAAAWANEENERRKALFAYLLSGIPTLVWYNIPRGSKISSAAIESALTSPEITDRVLGISNFNTALACTIQAWTGNAIGPKGDLASRTLVADLIAKRPDPENRKLAHSEPIIWTLNHRGKILNALYTILLGNPELKGATGRQAPTRFKVWWKLVGSGLEHAAGLCGTTVSFKDLFAGVEDAAEAEDPNVSVLEIIHKKWPTNTHFQAEDVREFLQRERHYKKLQQFQ